jgi:hypothetical protein
MGLILVPVPSLFVCHVRTHWRQITHHSSIFLMLFLSGTVIVQKTLFHSIFKMDIQPPNDPNRNNNNNNNNNDHQSDPKHKHNAKSAAGERNNSNNEAPMGIMGDLNDAPAVVVMFLVGVVTWFLRERCVC